ncbi:flagellar hook-associated protein FlgL [Trichococcus sp. K1Tr]|uniref:flagellar hook-associated protein FlgL n=1 Tax=Trichococcus sp. K1Tr TaxID=3020847 RepID=UPI00232DB732|nr:flagellar hook-associated protein FlgL [Trichococcus sp. K1Tr]MDB6353452.1 flagellar hook-associated protein FlgL [Trichococcus sp. K1Tr]
MRITDRITATNMIQSINRSQGKLEKYNNQLSSMKEISKPSDDPLRASQIMNLNNSLIQNEEFSVTIADTVDWTNMQDSALENATNSLRRITTLIQSASTGTMSDSDRQAIKVEMENEISTMVDSLNTNFGGKYVFSGMNTTTKPFEISRDANGQMTGIQYQGTQDGTDADGNVIPVKADLTRTIATGVDVSLKTDGRQLMNEQGTPAEKDDLGTFLADALKALDANDTESLAGKLLARSNKETENVVNMRTEIGAISNRLKSAQERNTSENINLKSIRSNKQDVDLAEKYMEFTMEQQAFQAALSMGTKILQTNILDYL